MQVIIDTEVPRWRKRNTAFNALKYIFYLSLYCISCVTKTLKYYPINMWLQFKIVELENRN